MLDLSIIIVTYNTRELTARCLRSIIDKKWQCNFEILVVDNASGDDSVQYLKKYFPQVKLIISDKNLGFAGGNDLALKKAGGRFILLLNSDTEVIAGSLDKLVDFIDREKFGIGSCRLLGPDEKFQPNAGDLPFGWPLLTWLAGLDDILPLKDKIPSAHRQYESYYQGDRSVGWVSGSVMIIKKAVLEKIGYLDEGIFMYSEDIEYCLRARRAGFTVGWTDRATIRHLGGASSKDPAFRQWTGEFKGLLYIYRKYYGLAAAFCLRLLLYLFILVRALAFFVTGKFKVSQTYVKVLVGI